MQKKNNLKNYLSISRPLSWLNTAMPYAIGYLAASQSFTWALVIGIIYFLFPYNLLLYGINDIFDYESDAKNPRKGGIEGAIVEKKNHKALLIAIAITNLPFLFLLLAIGSTSARIAILCLVAAAVFYSAPPLRLKEKPFIDSITSSCHFVLPAVVALLLAGSGNMYYAALVSFLLWGIASHSFGAIQDIQPDRASNIASIATVCGVKLTTKFSFWFYVLSIVIVIVGFWPNGIIVGLLLSFYCFNVSFFFKYKSDAKAHLFNRGWKNFLSLNYIIGFWLVQILLYSLDPFSLADGRIDLLAKFFILFAFLQTLLIIHNLAGFRRPKNNRISEYPKASILIHAFNQADNISSTLLAALGQNYPDYELIFTDLGSDDNTNSIATSYQDERIKIIKIDPLPAGWSINSWASSELLRKSSGEFIVLLSADTVLLPDTLGLMVSQMYERKLDVISLLPADQNKTLAQKLLLNLNRFFWLGFYPAAYLMKNAPISAAGYSGLMAFTKSGLEKINGFESVRKSPLEDLDLAASAKAHGLKTAFYLASELATTQNHASLRLIILQNIQRYYPALRYNYSLSVAVVTGGIFVLCLPTYLLVLELIGANQGLALSFVIGIAMAIGNRLIIAVTSRQSYFATIFYPITSLISFGWLILSICNYELLRPRWRSRTEL